MPLPVNTATATDAQLVALSLQNSDNFGMLVERYETKLLRYIRRLSGTRNPDAEDILQEAFIKIYHHLNDFDADLSFSSWAYRITRNTCLDWGRAHQKNQNRSVDLDSDDWEKIAGQADIGQQLDDKIFREKIADAISALGPKYRDPLLLYLLEEKTYEEISDILRCPTGTVGALISRGKQKLKTFLKDQPYVQR